MAESLGDPGAGLPVAAAVVGGGGGGGGGEPGRARCGLRVGCRSSSCALWAAAGLAAGQPPPRVRDPRPT